MEEATDITGKNGAGAGEPNLLYTVAFDTPETMAMRQMVKMLGGSVVRTYFTGDMVIFRNGLHPVFLVERRGIREEYVKTPHMDPQKLAEYAKGWKARASEPIDSEGYGWVVFLDADCLCLRNIDHLLADRDCEILYQPENGRGMGDEAFNGYLTNGEMEQVETQTPNIKAVSRPRHAARDEGCKPPPRCGINSGTWAVRGTCFRQVMERWMLIQAEEPVRETASPEQSAWNRLILDAPQYGWRAEPFEAHEVQFPLGADKDWKLYSNAAIIHCTGGTVPEKIQFMFGLYMQRFFHDASSTLLNVVER